MKDKIFSLIATVLLSVPLLFSGAISCRADSNNTVNELQRVIDGIVDYNLALSECDTVQEWLDTTLTDTAGVSSEWYVFTLCQSGDYDFSAYRTALSDYLTENDVPQAATRLKLALILYAVGGDVSAVSELASSSVGEAGIMSFVYGLHLMNNGIAIENHTAREVTDTLLSLQNSDGGWSLSGDVGDVDVTAMVVQSLSPHVSEESDVANAVESALSFLSERQRDNGGYTSYGVENPESACQVLVTLSSLDIDCTEDERFIKNGCTVIDAILEYRLDDGSFCHTTGGNTNGIATVQAYYSAVSYLLMSNDQPPLYIVSPHIITETPDSEETTETPEIEVERTEESETEKSTETSVNHSTNETTSPEETTVAEPTNPSDTSNDNGTSHTKAIICVIIIGVGGAVGVLLFVSGKRHRNNFVFLTATVAVALVIVIKVDFRSADDYYNGRLIKKDNSVGSVTLTIRCDTIAEISDSDIVPADGIILAETEFSISDNESVFDLLCEAARAYKIHVDSTGAGGMVYVSGISNIYEFDFGDLSGWVYRVNGEAPSVGCGEYVLHDNDTVEWLYTRDLGNDLD